MESTIDDAFCNYPSSFYKYSCINNAKGCSHNKTSKGTA